MNTSKINVLLLLFHSFFITVLTAHFHDIVIIITSYNNEKWCQKNLQSVFEQNYPKEHYRIIYIDDCSTDSTLKSVRQICNHYKASDRMTIIHNPKRLLKAENLYKAGHSCKPHELIIELDGDDWFPKNKNILSRINELFQDPELWAAYTNFIDWPSGKIETKVMQPPTQCVLGNTYRDFYGGNIWAGLRIYYAWLFQDIDIKDFSYECSPNHFAFLPVTIDAALMFAIHEKARSHCRYIPEVLLVHNTQTPLNDHKLRLKQQWAMEQLIRKKPRYKALEHALL